MMSGEVLEVKSPKHIDEIRGEIKLRKCGVVQVVLCSIPLTALSERSFYAVTPASPPVSNAYKGSRSP